MSTIKERPILFSGPMVRAILEGRKTQTRRAMKHQPILVAGRTWTWPENGLAAKLSWGQGRDPNIEDAVSRLSPWPTGSHIWVRETWAYTTDYDGQYLMDGRKALYRADGETCITPTRWRPSIHMFRWASRITLEVTGVRIERVQDITEEDIRAEGLQPDETRHGQYRYPDWSGGWLRSPIVSFSLLWNSLNEKRGFAWELNPWVWVVSFRRLKLG